MPKVSAEVRVSKAARGSAARVDVIVPASINATQLSALVHNVTTNKQVFTAAGLRACGGCKSGLDINILGKFQEVIQVEV